MEHWPADERQKTLPVKNQGRGYKRLQVHDPQYWNHPSLDYGTFGGATLVSSDGRLAWTTVVDTSNARRVTSVGAGRCIFPATRPMNPMPSRLAQWRRIEEGLNFVRTCFPDADFPMELVKAEFQSDERQNRALQVYDPLRGNLISIVPSSSTPQTSLVLFPVGETTSDLNISFISATNSDSTFHAPGRVASKFETPILQISTSNGSNSPMKRGTNTVLVRTLSATSLLSIESANEGTHFKATREVDILSDDAGGKSVADATFSPHDSDIIAVNTSGALYTCSIYQGAKAVRRIGPNEVNIENTNGDRFWRLRPSDQGYFLASSSFIQHHDFRSSQPAVDLFSTGQSGSVVTSFDWLEREHLLTISTTSELIWMDNRYPKKTLLSSKHNRAHDRSLNVKVVQLDSGPLTFLSSLKNGLVTIYDVSRGNDNLIHSHSVPTFLPHDGDMGAPDSESAFFVQPDRSTLLLLRLSGQGSFHCQDFAVCHNGIDILPRQTSGTSHDWSADVQKLAQRAKELQPQYGPLSARHFSEFNLRTAYQKIFITGNATEQTASEGGLAAMTDKSSQFWQRTENTDKAMLTLHDICLCTDEPDEASRADFLAGGIINSNLGYKKFIHNKLPVQEIASGAAWSCDFKQFLSRMGLGRVDQWEDMHGALEALNLSYSDDASGLFEQQEKESREQLILDLALSSMVFSAQPVSMSAAPIQADDVETMSLAAKALTLDDELPEIQFGYLRPYLKLGVDHYPNAFKGKDAVAEPAQDANISTPLGVRLLLREWEVGMDVESYTYYDPYNAEGDNIVAPSRKRAFPTALVATQTTTTTSQRPPLIVPGFDPRPPPIHIIQSHWGRSGTQPQGFNSQTTDIQNGNYHYPEPSQPSQELMTSTQVLPGRYGGRNAPTNKKLVKKRLGGSRPAILDIDWQRHETGLFVWSSKESYGWNKVRPPPINPWFNRDGFNDVLKRNKPVVCALSASYISTFVGYPLDSLKSRLQTTKTRMPVLKLAGTVYREEGVKGFYRGLWIPLVTISFVRAASFTIYSSTKEYCRKNNYFTGDRASHAALAGGLSGALSGSLISFTSAPFELVKVRRQLEYSIAATKGIQMVKPPNTIDAVREIFRTHGLSGLWIGFRLHFVRDTAGTALYFFEYDAMRHLLGRQRSGEQGPTPAWLPIPTSLIPFVCGSLAGVSSWALIYPLDVVKTKVQQRALAGTPPKGVWETLRRLVRGPDPKDPKPVLAGIARIYRGLGVSAVRSITTHGLLWTFFDITSHYIDHLP
ncbi:hypothetical protein DEU56DRAFT_845237 [Suillus clintonianus]|uniref:uncharacterized protein n=1 Tax=Suillus clintonianus TaxID=1904413 RepID=UPI001B8744AC|nr:uncharacterized protein DEU56DRAFT_845237 [Suillus clintonianus]KAG2157238.1 hypothetical protein DEU56DRAFT_845237 [Suillus clintonianus]